MANFYVDLSAAFDGDGTTAAQASAPGLTGAFNTLLNKSAWASGDYVWARRAGSIVITAACDFTTTQTAANIKSTGVIFVGSPISTDEDYSTRPATVTTNGWDADSASARPTISYAGTTAGTTVLTSVATTIKRFAFSFTGAITATNVAVVLQRSTSLVTFKYCLIELTNAANVSSCLQTSGAGSTTTMYGCEVNNAGTGNAVNRCVYAPIGSLSAYNCDFSGAMDVANAALVIVGSNGQNAGLFMQGCTVTHTSVNENSCVSPAGSGTTTSTALTMIDCTLDASAGVSGLTSPAFMVPLTVSSNNVAMELCIQNVTVLGRVLINMTPQASGTQYLAQAARPLHFAKIQQYRGGAAAALLVGNPVTVLVDEFLPATLSTPGGRNTNDIQANNGATIHVGHVIWGQTGANIIASVSTSVGALVYVSDDSDLTGAWKCYQLVFGAAAGNYNTITSSNVYRSGGSPYSLSFQQKFGSTLFPASRAPLFPIGTWIPSIFVDLASGANTITIYCALKSYTNAPTTQELWFEVTYYSGSGATKATATSQTVNTGGTVIVQEANGAALASDGSTWVNDSGLTSVKLTLAVATGKACRVAIRGPFLHKIDASGKVYVDPTPVVT